MNYYITDETLIESLILDGHVYETYIVYSKDSRNPIILYYTDGELDCIRTK